MVQGSHAIDSPDYHLKATFHFDDAVAADWALRGPQGLAAAADRQLMAPDEGDVLMFWSTVDEMPLD